MAVIAPLIRARRFIVFGNPLLTTEPSTRPSLFSPSLFERQGATGAMVRAAVIVRVTPAGGRLFRKFGLRDTDWRH